MRIVITGGAGFIGANLCSELLGLGAEVAVLDDLSTGRAANLEGMDVDFFHGSILDEELLRKVCVGAHSIVHLAAIASVPYSVDHPMQTHRVNATGTLNVCDAARGADAHLVVASSSAVYGREPAQPKSEDMPVAPTSPYAADKVATESYVRAYQESFALQAIAFRFFNVFGPLQPADHPYAAAVPTFVDAALRGEQIIIYGDGEQTRDFTFVSTVTSALAEAAITRMTYPGPVNLAGGHSVTINSLVELLARILGRPLATTHVPERRGDVRHSHADTTMLNAMFPDLRATSLEAAVRETVQWMAADAGDIPEAGAVA